MGLRPIAVIDYDQNNLPNIYTIHTDHLGTPQIITNANQKIVWQGAYDAFGNVTVQAFPHSSSQDIKAKKKGWSLDLINQANAADDTIHKEPFEFNLRFAGQYEDSESGYYYNWHRYYDPKTGRYLTSDPIGLNGGLNTYGYAGQNPVSAVDPWGLSTIVEFVNGIEYRVIGAYNDSDTNIYQLIVDKDKCRQDIIGQTFFDDEFISPETGNVYNNYKILLGSTFTPKILEIAKIADEMDLREIAARSGSGGSFDIKKDYPNTGALLNGKYITSRSAGNYLAGFNAQHATYLGKGISYDTFQKLAGALHVKSSKGESLTTLEKIEIVVTGKAYGPAPFYGEVEYQYRMSKMGWEDREGASR